MLRISLSRTIGTQEALILMRNLAIALKAGVPLARALKLFEDDASASRKPLIAHLRRSVEQGQKLADAMESAPRRFTPLAINLVRTGELGGILEESLQAVVNHLQKSKELSRKVRSAMMYPMFVLVAVIGLGLSIGTLVLPRLIPLFESLDVELPWMTRVLLQVAVFFQNHGVVFSAAVILSIIVLVFCVRLAIVKPFWHRVILTIPYLRDVVRMAAIAQITRTMGLLLKSGVPIKDALEATGRATENRIFRAALSKALTVVESGHTLAEGLQSAGRTFPRMTVTLIDIGEETGTLSQTLEYLADHYEAEVEYALKNLTTALEPILLIGVGILVGGVVLAIVTPIYEVTGNIR